MAPRKRSVVDEEEPEDEESNGHSPPKPLESVSKPRKALRTGRSSSRVPKEPEAVVDIADSDDDEQEVLNVNQQQVVDTIRRKRQLTAAESLPTARNKRKHNIENQLEVNLTNQRKPGRKPADKEPDPPRNGDRLVRKSSRNLRSSSNLTQHLPNGHSEGKSNGDSSGKSNGSAEEPKHVYSNPTPAMMEILRKISEKNKAH